MRPSWDHYFLDLARSVATRATCPRRRVGAVLTYDRRVLSTGYNGSPPGCAHCDDVGCYLDNDSHCIRVAHAELNAVAQAAKAGVSLNRATAYVSIRPCFGCAKILASAGVKRVVYAEEYGGDYPFDVGLELVRL